MSPQPIRVLIVEDHQVVAEALAALLNDHADITVVGHIGSVAEASRSAEDSDPDIVVLDFRLTDGTGVEAGAAILRIRPSAKLIFLTRDDSDRTRLAALESGASAFVHKSRAAAEVIDAIRQVASGKSLITPQTVAALLSKGREADTQRESLTPREKEVLSRMAAGASSREIASTLGISYATVRTHIRALGSKLGVHSKLQAIAKARELALID
jgi:two-component system, NarL family, nitrate/nitrite response regulator NarL